MITTVHHILDFLHDWAPQHLKEDYDNVGLLVGNPNQEVTGILTCLDVTDQVIEEAVQSKCNLIVAHHPLIFRKLAAVRHDDPVGKLVIRLLEQHISVIAVHTNLDAARNGVSFVLADQLRLKDTAFLQKRDDDAGFGVIGSLSRPMNASDFLQHCSMSLMVPVIRHSGTATLIERVAVCGGAGSFLIDTAIRAGAQAFVTADLKYHDFFVPSSEFLLCDAGHYETEIPISETLRTRIGQQFSSVPVLAVRHSTNPVRYYSRISTT